jgi:hypothetical protein
MMKSCMNVIGIWRRTTDPADRPGHYGFSHLKKQKPKRNRELPKTIPLAAKPFVERGQEITRALNFSLPARPTAGV